MPSQELVILATFWRKEKSTCWSEFQDLDNSILSTLANLGRDEEPDDDIKVPIKKFVCKLYVPKADMTTVKELRWFLF